MLRTARRDDPLRRFHTDDGQQIREVTMDDLIYGDGELPAQGEFVGLPPSGLPSLFLPSGGPAGA